MKEGETLIRTSITLHFPREIKEKLEAGKAQMGEQFTLSFSGSTPKTDKVVGYPTLGRFKVVAIDASDKDNQTVTLEVISLPKSK